MIALLLLWSLAVSVSEGDKLFAGADYSQAAIFYEAALSGTSDSSMVLSRLARTFVCMADIADDDQKLVLYRKAEEFAVRSIHANAENAEAHTWRAAALGNIAMFEGGKTKVRLAYEIKAELDTAIVLNPCDDIAYSILGSFYFAIGTVSWIERQLAVIFLGGLPEGGLVDAERALQRAIAIAPDVIRHHFELGQVYISMDRNHEAAEEFQRALMLPDRMGSDSRTKKSAREMLARIEEGHRQ